MAVTMHSTSPVKLAFELSAQGCSFVWFSQLECRSLTDNQLLEGIKTCQDLGLEVRGMPSYARKFVENAAYRRHPVTHVRPI
jgi:hypothetical protein